MSIANLYTANDKSYQNLNVNSINANQSYSVIGLEAMGAVNLTSAASVTLTPSNVLNGIAVGTGTSGNTTFIMPSAASVFNYIAANVTGNTGATGAGSVGQSFKFLVENTGSSSYTVGVTGSADGSFTNVYNYPIVLGVGGASGASQRVMQCQIMKANGASGSAIQYY